MTLFSVMFGFLSLYFLCISQRFSASVTVVVYLGGLVAKSGLTCDSMHYSPPGSPCPWDFPGKNAGMGSISFSRVSSS